MRMFFFFATLILLAAVGIAALENTGEIELRFLRQPVATQQNTMFAALYVAGMVTALTALGFLRRTFRRDRDNA